MQQISMLGHAKPGADNKSAQIIVPIRRRSFFSGKISVSNNPDSMVDLSLDNNRWMNNEPMYLPGIVKTALEQYSPEIAKAEALYQCVLAEEDVDDILAGPEYEKQLIPEFELLSSRYDAGDEQEICSIDFDTHINGELIEDIWMRLSWLSFDEEDASLRFRFSFGLEGLEDVSQDLQRQRLAAKLEERIFQESAIITQHETLNAAVAEIIGHTNYEYLERIVYFNAPNGGAQFHHDAEKGHVGVVYAQLSGKTFWLALSKAQLIQELQFFIADENNQQAFKQDLLKEKLDTSFIKNIAEHEFIEQALNDLFHPELMLLLNKNKAFFEQLVKAGYAYFLQEGDVLLLPQESMNACAWHSVFCVGEKAGEALSFAIKTLDK